jgi:FkbM family methyltransferase
MKIFLQKLVLFPLVLLNSLAIFYCKLFSRNIGGVGGHWLEKQAKKNNLTINNIIHQTTNHQQIRLSVYSPNQTCRFRASTFSTKEPETLAWLDDYGKGCVLFDVGANIGLYSLYHAKVNNAIVYAFEPSVFNLTLLAKNIYLNNIQHLVKIIPNPLTNLNEFADFSLSTIEEGGAVSAFGVDYGNDGKKLEVALSYQCLGFTLDYLVSQKIIPHEPNIIKIDVDGIEHLILAGAVETLRNPSCRSVLVEINKAFVEQAQRANEILVKCGFKLKETRQSNTNRDGSISSSTFNQIWFKV